MLIVISFFGACTEVERLWSVAKFILTDEAKRNMSPVVFEAIICLQINKMFWDLNEIVEVGHARQRVNNRANREAVGGISKDEA